MSFRDMVTGLVGTDRATFAAEFTSAVSVSLWGVFDQVNVDDSLAKAYKAQYPNEEASQPLHEQWEEMVERGPESARGFISGLKGKVAEFEGKAQLEDSGFTNVKLAPTSNQEGWDISAVDPEGQAVPIQVKTGTSYSASDVQGLMEDSPDNLFALSAEIYDKVIASGTETGDSIVAILPPDFVRVEEIKDGLDTLSANMGIDIPDGLVDIAQSGAVIVGATLLIYNVLKTEREFQEAERTIKNQMQVVRTLTLMTRIGINAVLVKAGVIGGAWAGSFMPGPGNVIGGVSGLVAGAAVGHYLNKRLQPKMLNIALDITGLTRDDLFYYKNKSRIDATARAFKATSVKLAAAHNS